MRKLSILVLILLILGPLSKQAGAISMEQSFTNVYTLNDNSAVDGDIVISGNQGLTRTTTPYNSTIFGVVQKTPVVVYQNGSSGETPVARSGNAEVNVTTINGAIHKGDYITTSIISGKGQKATQSGYVVGVALENFNSSQAKSIVFNSKSIKEGQIQAAISINYVELNSSQTIQKLLDLLNNALFQDLQNPAQFTNIIKYIFAGLIAILSFVFGYLTFSRSLVRSIEAIGRNPLAKNTIIFSLILNIGLTIVTTLIGVGLAIVLLKL